MLWRCIRKVQSSIHRVILWQTIYMTWGSHMSNFHRVTQYGSKIHHTTMTDVMCDTDWVTYYHIIPPTTPWQWWVISSAGPNLSTLDLGFRSNMYWTNTRLECLQNLFRNSPTPHMLMIGCNSTMCSTNGARSQTILMTGTKSWRNLVPEQCEC